MFDVAELVKLGLFNHMIPVWQVFIFVVALLPFLLWNRVKLCLLITYLFTFYLGFIVQCGDYLASSGSLLPFFLYASSGIAITVAFVALRNRSRGPAQEGIPGACRSGRFPDVPRTSPREV